MSEPKRIQRKRTKGWRMPDGAIYVGRPSKWGNPYRAEWVAYFGEWWVKNPNGEGLLFSGSGPDASYLAAWQASEYFRRDITPGLDITPLRGHDLACWCPLDQPCHADVLLEIANRP